MARWHTTVTESLGQARLPITAVVKLGAHSQLILRSVASKRSRGWLAAGAASLVTDALLTRKLADPAYRPGLGYYAIEAVDAAVWGLGADTGPMAPAATMMADGFPSAVEAGYGAASSRDALPVYDPAAASLAPWKAAALHVSRVLVPTVVPFGATWATRRWRGKPTSVTNFVWPVMGAMVGFAASHHRNALQSRSRQQWNARAQSLVSQERTAGQIAFATSSSIGHHFKKTLYVLGLEGSARAMAAALDQASWPAELVATTSGQMLGRTAQGVRIEPPDQGVHWLSEPQVGQVEEFLDLATEQAPDGVDQILRVTHLPGFVLRIDYLGRSMVLQNAPPPLVVHLNPTAAALFLTAGFKLVSALPAIRSMPLSVAAPTAVIDVLMAGYFWAHPPEAANIRWLVLGATCNCLIGLAAAASSLNPPTVAYGPNYPAFSSLRDTVIVLMINWGGLNNRQRSILPALALTAFGATMNRLHDRDWSVLSLVAEAATPLNGLAAFRVADRVEQEAAAVEAQLFDRYAREISAARQAGFADEARRYEEQLDTARQALEELASLDPETRRQLESDCDELEEWLGRLR